MLRTSISLDDNTVRKLDRIQKTHGHSSRSSAITGIINDYESAMLQLEVLQEYFRVTKGIVNPTNQLLHEREEAKEYVEEVEKSEEVNIQPKNVLKHINKFKGSHNNIPD